MKLQNLIILILSLFLVTAISINADSYWDYLTKAYADTLYCPITGGCGGGGSNASNITGIGSTGNLAVWYNTTHLTYNTSAIGGSGAGDYVPYTGATQDVNLSFRNITANIYYFNRNESLGIWSNTTDTVIGFIGGLS